MIPEVRHMEIIEHTAACGRVWGADWQRRAGGHGRAKLQPVSVDRNAFIHDGIWPHEQLRVTG